jgi:hypothetical protein
MRTAILKTRAAATIATGLVVLAFWGCRPKSEGPMQNCGGAPVHVQEGRKGNDNKTLAADSAWTTKQDSLEMLENIRRIESGEAARAP